jgi:hypothetical protein
MKKVIRLTESELVRLVSKVISEQAQTDNISKSYDLVIKGAKGNFGRFGTHPRHIIGGLSLLKNGEEFYKLNDMFKDKKTGYGSFDEMIRGEFEYTQEGAADDNRGDLKQITDLLKKWGVKYNYGKENVLEKFTILPKTIETFAGSPNVDDWTKVKQYLESNGFPPDFPKESLTKKEGDSKLLLKNNEHIIAFLNDGKVKIAKKDMAEGGYVRILQWTWDGTKPVLSGDYKTEQTTRAKGYATTEQQILDGTHILGNGSSGDLVKKVQFELKDDNSNPGNCGENEQSCDGIYGPKTRKAVKQMQIKSGLKGKDGIVGRETWNYLYY